MSNTDLSDLSIVGVHVTYTCLPYVSRSHVISLID